jgi:hypothetical protein
MPGAAYGKTIWDLKHSFGIKASSVRHNGADKRVQSVWDESQVMLSRLECH